MSVFYKKVDAVQLLLSTEEFEALKAGKHHEFLGTKIKYPGGLSYFVILNQGENQIKVSNTQWVVRHPEGAWQVLWPFEFEENFVAAPQDSVDIKTDAFTQKSFNQPTAVL